MCKDPPHLVIVYSVIGLCLWEWESASEWVSIFFNYLRLRIVGHSSRRIYIVCVLALQQVEWNKWILHLPPSDHCRLEWRHRQKKKRGKLSYILCASRLKLARMVQCFLSFFVLFCFVHWGRYSLNPWNRFAYIYSSILQGVTRASLFIFYISVLGFNCVCVWERIHLWLMVCCKSTSLSFSCRPHTVKRKRDFHGGQSRGHYQEKKRIKIK